jgi:hypothetical protein
MDTQKDQDTPNRSSNMEKPEGDRKSEWGEGTSEGAGKSIRPMDEGVEDQSSVPEQGQSKTGGQAE